MKVLLNQDIESLGRMGDIVDVARGYARNYLIPRGLAVGVTRGSLKEIEEKRRVLKAKAERLRQTLEGIAEKLKSERIVIKARCSASGKLFGSVTNRQLAKEIEERVGCEIDRHKILIDERIRTVGTYKAHIKLHPDIEFDLEFEVEGEGFVPEEAVEQTPALEEGVLESAIVGESEDKSDTPVDSDTGSESA